MTSRIVDSSSIRRNYIEESGKIEKTAIMEHFTYPIIIATKYNTMMRGELFTVPWIPSDNAGTVLHDETTYNLGGRKDAKYLFLHKKEVQEACDDKYRKIDDEKQIVMRQMPWMFDGRDTTDARFFAYYSQYESVANLTRYKYEFENSSECAVSITLKQSSTNQYMSPVRFSVYSYTGDVAPNFESFERESTTLGVACTDNMYQILNITNTVTIAVGAKFQILFNMSEQQTKGSNVIQTYNTQIKMSLILK
jgi:hypothetical protein